MVAYIHSTWFSLWTRRVWLLTGLTTPTLAWLEAKLWSRRYGGVRMKEES